MFYRGLHCPICTKYLLELERLAADFASRGVQVVAISSDTDFAIAKDYPARGQYTGEV